MSFLLNTFTPKRGRGWAAAARFAASLPLLLTGFCFAPLLQAQLTVTPARTAGTLAGTGTLGYSGDGAAATSASVASPHAVAYDASGNLYIADTRNHVIREVLASNGTIVTVAGSGTAGFAGDGGAATSALLDTPTGVAVDASGNLYIADSRNHRVRKVASGTITTVAGTGTAGFSGDGAAATAAQLALPSGVAVDASGNLYIADTNNERVRKVTGTTITTVAGNGNQDFTGDGAASTAAALDSPVSVAVDAGGNIYIADTHNQRVRIVNANGTIYTLAGSGTPTFTGGFSGDNGSATAATLAKPTGVSVDAPTGNVYIADLNNQRIRALSNGTITTVAGTGTQDFSGDGGAATAATFNAPRSVGTDALGNIAVADSLNQRVRSGALPTFTFATQSAGTTSTAQAVTLTNSGTSSLTVTAITYTGAFANASGGTCSAVPITLAAGVSCTQNVAFAPTGSGGMLGTVTFSGTGTIAQRILLTGTATAGTPTANSQSVTTAFNTATAITLTGSDPDSPPLTLTYTVLTAPTHGTLSGTAPNLTYTPTTNYQGADSFTFRVSNGINNSNTATVSITVTPGTPTANSQSVTTPINTAKAITLTGTDPDSPALALSYTVTTTPSHGTLSGTAPNLTYTPTANYVGADSFTFRVSNGTNSSNTATVSITVADTLASLTITGLPARTSRGEAQTVTVTAIGASGATFTGFTGTVVLTSSDTAAVLTPASYAYTATDAGVHSFSVALNSYGGQSITATSGSVSTQTITQVGGYIWVVSNTSGADRFDENGNSLATTGSGAAQALYGGLAFDHAGDSWSVVSTRNSILFTNNTATTSSTLTGGGLSTPAAVAIDGSGAAWVANSGNNSVSVFSNGGAAVSGTSGFGSASVTAPRAVAIDGTGGVWTANSTAGTVTHLFGAAAPVVTPQSSAVANGTTGVKP